MASPRPSRDSIRRATSTPRPRRRQPRRPQRRGRLLVLGLSLALIAAGVPRALAADTGDDPFSDFGSPGQQEDLIQTVQRSPGDEAFGSGSPDIEGDVTGGAWQPPDQGGEGWTASLPAAAQDDLTVTGGAVDRALAGQLNPSHVSRLACRSP